VRAAAADPLCLLASVSPRVVSSPNLPTLLQTVIDSASEITGACYGALAVFDRSGDVSASSVSGGASNEKAVHALRRGDTALLAWLRHHSRSLRLRHASDHPWVAALFGRKGPAAALLGTPIRCGNEELGALFVMDKAQGGEFTSTDENALVLLASQAALAIRNTEHRLRETTAHAEAEAARRALVETRARIRKFVERAPDLMFRYRLKPSPAFAYVSSSATTITGYSPDEFCKDPGLVSRCVHPDDRPLFESALKSASYPGDSLLLRWTRKDGALVWLDIRGVVIRNEAGNPIEIEGVVRDATARKRTEQTLEEARQRLQTLVEMSPVGVLVIDAAQRVALVNREMQRLTRSPCAPGDAVETCRRGITYRRPDGSAYATDELPVERALHRGENIRAEEVRFEFADGHGVPTLVSAAPVYSPEGQIKAAISIVQDVSPLEDVERLRNEFLGMVSHELRTPLAAIKGAAATVLGSPEPFSPAETRELFSIINNQADRLRGMVDNLLQMASIESGSLSITPSQVDLGTLLQEATASFTRVEGGRDIRVPDLRDLPPVQADRARILQVMANLLSNAAKFSPPESPIAISVERDASQVTVRVRDQGRGIPKEKLPHLFRKFSRIHENGDSRLTGSGLGLAISKGIVEAHGGRIWAETQGEGQGSTFGFTLPLAVQQPTTTASGASPASAVPRGAERAQVLVVDDEIPTLRYVQRHLQQAGYQPLAASDGAEAISIIEKKQPAVALLALNTPGMNGLDLLRHIRTVSHAPVIFLVASDDRDAAAQALNAGADDYILKPFSSSELLARVRATLRRRTVTEATEDRPPFTIGDLTVNFAERRVTVGGHDVHLTATEYKLLCELAVHAGQVLTHDQILRRVWGPEYSQEPELVRSFIRHLRQKLGEDARRPRYVLTERQVGYHMPRV